MLSTATGRFTDELEEVVRRLVEHYRPLRIILFGSHAWGQPEADSDVDLLLVKETGERFLDRLETASTLLYETGRVPFPVDLLVYTPRELEERLRLGDPFIRRIVESGEVLYDAAGAGVGGSRR
jgi:uncharacterized protein